jgi:hypothetical protein
MVGIVMHEFGSLPNAIGEGLSTAQCGRYDSRADHLSPLFFTALNMTT